MLNIGSLIIKILIFMYLYLSEYTQSKAGGGGIESLAMLPLHPAESIPTRCSLPCSVLRQQLRK